MAAAKSSVSGDGEVPPPSSRGSQQGSMITTPFIIASFTGMAIAGGGWLSNLIVFLISQFNIKSINAAQINNVVIGTSSFLPIIAAILADSFLGCFSVIWISSLISLAGLILLVLTVTVDGLKPSDSATALSRTQYAVLFTAMTLGSIGQGGTRFTLATMGANQLAKPLHQATFFNWYFLSTYVSAFISATGILYVEDNVSWALGFGVGIMGNVIALIVFLLGRRYYCCRESGNGSPFTGFARVLVAGFRKRKSGISSRSSEDYYYGDGEVRGMALQAPSNSFRLLNHAALKTEGDILPNGSIANSWRLCSVQQVEDLKSVIRILPLWSTSILLSTPIGIQASLTVLQALATDRHLGRHFQVPAGSVLVITLVTTSISLSLFDRCLFPVWRKVFGRHPTPLQQIGIGHVLTVTSMVISALVESRRRRSGRAHQMAVLWLFPQLIVVGIGEAFHFPGQVRLYYREFPMCLKSMATAMIAMLIGIGYYLSTVVIDFVRRVTGWLPDNIDDGRVDNVYWVLVVIGVVNFGYYFACSWFYKCKSDEVTEEYQIQT